MVVSKASSIRSFVFSAASLLVVFAILSSLVRSESEFPSAIRLPSDGGGRGGDASLCSESAASIACPVKCFRTDPVCGVDGVTYWCGCAEALCARTTVAKLGFCEVGNGGSSGQAFLLVHIVWLILLGFLVLFGIF